MVRVRPFVSDDVAFGLSLGPRLAVGMQPWRDAQLWLKTVEGWLMESNHQSGRGWL